MTINNVASTQLNTSMIRVATGQRINSAADDAAGLAISERMTAQIRGLDQGTNNVMNMQNLVNTAEGGLSSINDNLQRMRELTLQATNAVYTDSDRQNIQTEINQIMSEIDATASRTEFNGMRLLEGGFSAEDGRGLYTAADSAGRGPTVNIGNMTSDMILGPEEFNVVGSTTDQMQANLQRIDNAMARVNSERAYLGAMSNRFDTTIASNQITNLNTAAARSRIADADIALEVMRMEQASVIEQAQLLAEQRNQEQQGVQMASLLG
ncbi:MAG: flagellin [Defluviitaleaceae bacterium]|nr:flagellin [Defluviitaleaceae bacterium]